MNFPPVSIKVRTPWTAFIQSVREKKSDSTLNEPHTLQAKGNTAMMSHVTTITLEKMTSAGGRRSTLPAMLLYTALRLKSRQVRISTGISSTATPRIVSREVAAAEPNS